MPLLFYWRHDNYIQDLDDGAGYHLNSKYPVLHEVERGDSVWAIARRPDGTYVLAAELIVHSTTHNSPGYKYGSYRVWGNLETSRYFALDAQTRLRTSNSEPLNQNDGHCQICRWDPVDKYGEPLCEGHHIQWLSRGGDDIALLNRTAHAHSPNGRRVIDVRRCIRNQPVRVTLYARQSDTGVSQPPPRHPPVRRPDRLGRSGSHPRLRRPQRSPRPEPSPAGCKRLIRARSVFSPGARLRKRSHAHTHVHSGSLGRTDESMFYVQIGRNASYQSDVAEVKMSSATRSTASWAACCSPANPACVGS